MLYNISLERFRKLTKNLLPRGATTLIGVTTIGKFISIAASFILTRLYVPEDFGTQTLFSTILSQILVLSSLRYEWAIITAKKVDAIYLLLICLLLTSVNSAILLFVILCWGDYITALFHLEPLRPYLALLPPSILLAGYYQALNYWLLRCNDLKSIAHTKISQSLSSSFVQITAGFLLNGPVGLIGGTILNLGVGTFRLISVIWKEEKRLILTTSISRLLEVCQKYRNFPLISVWSSFLNFAGLAAAPLSISYYYGIGDLGLFSLAQGLIFLPSSIVGNAIFQSLLAHASSLIHEDPIQLQHLYERTFLTLLSVGTALSICFWLSPHVFPLLFGEKWYEAGLMVQRLVPYFLASFITSSLSILDWLEKQTWMLGWNTLRLIIVYACFSFANRENLTSIDALTTFSLAMAGLYSMLLGMNFFTISRIRASSQKNAV